MGLRIRIDAFSGSTYRKRMKKLWLLSLTAFVMFSIIPVISGAVTAKKAKSVQQTLQLMANFPNAKTLVRGLQPFLNAEDYGYLLKVAPTDGKTTAYEMRVQKNQFFINKMKTPFVVNPKGDEISFRGQVLRLKPNTSLQTQIENFQDRLRSADTASVIHAFILPTAFAQDHADYIRGSFFAAGALAYVRERNQLGNESFIKIAESPTLRKLSKSPAIESINCLNFGNPDPSRPMTARVNFADGNYAVLSVPWAGHKAALSGAQVQTGGKALGKDRSVMQTHQEAMQYSGLLDFCLMTRSEQTMVMVDLKKAQTEAFEATAATPSPSFSTEGLDSRPAVQ